MPSSGRSQAVQCAASTKEEAETCPLIRLAFGQPPSPKGEGFAGGASPSPTEVKNALPFQVGEALGPPARIYTESVGWETQAQSENRSKIKFCTPRAPVGPDSNAPKHS